MDANEVWCPTCRKYHCWRPGVVTEPQKKTVWQWRYRIDDRWIVLPDLMTEDEIRMSMIKSPEKHAGPFEVDV